MTDPATAGHGGWRDADRHRSTLHIALHFFLPGTASMIAVLGAGSSGGWLWRTAFVIVGLVGTAESLSFLRTPGGPVAPAGRTLDPLPYLAVVAGAFVAPDQLPIAPLQLSGAPEPGATKVIASEALSEWIGRGLSRPYAAKYSYGVPPGLSPRRLSASRVALGEASVDARRGRRAGCRSCDGRHEW